MRTNIRTLGIFGLAWRWLQRAPDRMTSRIRRRFADGPQVGVCRGPLGDPPRLCDKPAGFHESLPKRKARP